MDIEIVIYGIIGALAILVCWLLDNYSPTMGEESLTRHAKEFLRSEKSSFILPTCSICRNIRNGQGNWHEKREYREDCQGVIGY